MLIVPLHDGIGPVFLTDTWRGLERSSDDVQRLQRFLLM